MVLSSNQRDISSQLSGELDWKRQKDLKWLFIVLLKLINRNCKILWLKSTSIFKEHTRIRLRTTIEKTWCRQKKNNNWAILTKFSPCRFQVDETRHIPTKNLRKKPSRDQISFGFQLQTFLWHGNTKKFQSKTWNPDLKNHFKNRGSYIRQHNEVKEKQWAVFSFMSEQILSTRSKTCMRLRKFKFFLVCTGQKPKLGMRRATNEQVH